MGSGKGSSAERGSAGVSAAVLVGGRSRRMGVDKAWLDLGDGRPMVARVIEVLAAVADDVFIVGDDGRYAELALRVVPDRYPGRGVLGGIATAVAAAVHERVLVVGCDMPLLCAEALRLLVDLSEGWEAVVPLVKGEREPLHALYTRACLPAMERALESGPGRAVSFLPDVRRRDVSEGELRAVDPALESLVNVNTPADLASLRSRSSPPRRSAYSGRPPR